MSADRHHIIKLPSRAERRARRRLWRKELAQQKHQLAQKISENRRRPMVAALLAKQKRRRRQRQLALLLAVLVLLMLAQCECEPEPAPAVAKAEPAPELPLKKKSKPKRKTRRRSKATLDGKIKNSSRAAMAVNAPAAPPWLAQFRLQVAARSPRLASCFVGSERPGALRWSALVHARSGLVSDSEIEPAFRGVSLDAQQRVCLIKGLTEKRYNLDEPDEKATARRVSLIFEF